ncbi:protein of unknown function DUF885 [hydrothermal vent metagenome]|uniref:Lipoprotein n=1 Tax=hydrothermal vent metagenome TaxID=652676 RepID=A0A3B0SPA9_9ZZZZ
MRIKLVTSAAILALVVGCTPAESVKQQTAKETKTAETMAVAEQTESQRLNVFFQEQFKANLARSPMFKAYIGQKDEDYGKWDDPSLARNLEDYQLQIQAYEKMKAAFDFDKLDDNAKLSWRLSEFNAQRAKRNLAFIDYAYAFHQMRGPHSQIPAFLINQHTISNEQDAKDYVSRLQGVTEYLGENLKNSRRRFEDGIYPPAFVFPKIIDAAKNVISGAPFTDAADSPLLEDFKNKLAKLDLSDEVKTKLIADAKAALLSSVKPAYDALIAEMQVQGKSASDDDGVWKLPNGAAYYASRLKSMTTTDMTPTQIHDLGLSEVARIHEEMRRIMKTVNYEGTLPEFMEFMRTDPQFYYPDTDEGRAAYLAEATRIIDVMRTKLDDIFITKPKAKIIVKAVEPFREATAGKAFYQRPAMDGSRPGTYYANLYRMESMPTYQMEALAYHEGIPGHHMQGSIAQELQDIPMFRKMGGYTAYSEGWGLYSEFAPKEMGFYSDPYSDFGRLSMELWRAARLVVDTGLHDKRWSRQQAIDYLATNTPNSLADATNAIERYIVMPGQATAYKIGMLKIQELRARSKAELGDKFDIREFHDVVLANGAVPLAVLEQLVNEWVQEKQAG